MKVYLLNIDWTWGTENQGVFSTPEKAWEYAEKTSTAGNSTRYRVIRRQCSLWRKKKSTRHDKTRMVGSTDHIGTTRRFNHNRFRILANSQIGEHNERTTRKAGSEHRTGRNAGLRTQAGSASPDRSYRAGLVGTMITILWLLATAGIGLWIWGMRQAGKRSWNQLQIYAWAFTSVMLIVLPLLGLAARVLGEVSNG